MSKKKEKPLYWERLKEAGIERPYHRGDIASFFGINRPESHAYDADFQRWIESGVRFCELHPIPFRWHLAQAISCPKCKEIELAKNTKTDTIDGLQGGKEHGC